MSKPRVVRIIARLNTGGPARHVLALRDLESFDTTIVAGFVSEGEIELPAAAGIVIHRIPELGRQVRPLDDLVAFWRVFRLLRRTRPAVVHTHTAKAGFIGRLAAVIARVPNRVHTFHGHVFEGYFSRPLSALVVLIERLLGRMTTQIIAISVGQRRDLSQTYRIAPASKITVVPLGLDLSPFLKPAPNARGRVMAEFNVQRGPIVISVGRLVPIKNLRLLLDAAHVVAKNGRQFSILIVGGGSEEAALKSYAEELGLGSVCHFTGWREDIDLLYAAADVAALTSNNEGTPVALIEAYTSGCSVVATDVGGVRDVAPANEPTFALVPRGNVEAFAEALERSLKLDRSAPRAEFSKRFSTEQLRANVRNLYDRLLSETGSPNTI